MYVFSKTCLAFYISSCYTIIHFPCKSLTERNISIRCITTDKYYWTRSARPKSRPCRPTRRRDGTFTSPETISANNGFGESISAGNNRSQD